MDATLEPLMRLQERDGKRLATEKELRSLPAEQAQLDKARATEQASMESERSRLRELELEAKRTEHAIQAAEQHSSKLKGQQMQVKKNDEYQALGREIEAASAEQGRLEEVELGLLYRLDTERVGLKQAEESHRKAMAELDARVAKLRDREAGLRARLKAELTEVEQARTQVPSPLLAVYDRLLKINRFPVLAALNGGVCGGCHMRVSSGIEQDARRMGKVTTCDNCGRVLFTPA